MTPFRSSFANDLFRHKYAHEGAQTWKELAWLLARHVCEGLLPQSRVEQIARYIELMWFIPGGRYLYYAGRPNPFFNNCYIFISQEDSREDWAYLSWKAERALMTGGGIGNDYSIYRPEGSVIKRTGGLASGPVSKMLMVNEIGRHVMQGGSRRSALYASLKWQHPDARKLLHVKDWDNQPVGNTGLTVGDLKRADFNFAAPLDMTNVSLNYDTEWLESVNRLGWDHAQIFRDHVEMALRNGEPGWSFNFYEKEKETGRNACTEVTSADDSDVCNLGSLNLSRIPSLSHFSEVVSAATDFLLCGTLRAKLPYDEVYKVRERNRRLGLGLMGVHEWLLARGYRYEVVPELHDWLAVYRDVSDVTAAETAFDLGISEPVAKRAIAPTGTIGIMAGTTTGIEPLFAVAYKRRYLVNGTQWKYQYVVDSTARIIAEQYGIDPRDMETALDLAADPERRIKVQYDVQKYVDMGISSTINLPAWGSELNNPDRVPEFAALIAKYAHGLRGLTVYPDGARGGQPLVPVDYDLAVANEGEVFEERSHDVCDITGKGGVCGI